ncbi:hypothetical protein HPB48_020978 [Haemaphysalis longicornis]|uniref:Uncharacterized protein n=1 Tax=Haemaphysalis longicornis TaxID=44386 RepID=A0A9J6FBS1_HAELO|nr:hypothetical protein HPB48_020978 [Haemaphysalis longicornis]
MSPAKIRNEVVKFFKDFRQEMRDMCAAMEKELKEEFNELKQSVAFFSSHFDAMATRCSEIEKENTALKKENAVLFTECNSLKQVVTAREQRMTDLEQYSRIRNVEVNGIPEVANEKLPDILKKLGEVVSGNISEGDIGACHRVPRRDGGCTNIAVQLTLVPSETPSLRRGAKSGYAPLMKVSQKAPASTSMSICAQH